MEVCIEHLDRGHLSEARKLVWRVFPHQDLFERLSFWAIKNHRAPHVRWILTCLGVDFLDFWGAIDRDNGALLGTTGLYQYAYDAQEAVWLAWFCVAPEVRRKGIGSLLLDFSIKEAKRTGLQFLRLYTSDSSGEAAAQLLYESRGLKVTARKRHLFYTRIYREFQLVQMGNRETD